MLPYFRAFGRLNRDVKLYLVAFGLVAFAYFGIMAVLFNLYLSRLGFDAQYIGLLIGSGQLVWAILALPAGAAGVRIGLTRALVLGEALITVGFSLVLLVEWLPRELWEGWLIGAWMILWLGAALFAVNGVPFLMAATGEGERTYAFSLQAAISALLGFGGSLVAGWLPGVLAGWMGMTLEDPAPYRLAMWLAPITFALACLLFVAMRPVAAPDREDKGSGYAAAPLALFLFFTVMVFLAACGEGAVRGFFNLYLDGALGVSTAQIGAAMGISQLLPVITALLTPFLLTRLGAGMAQVAATLTVAASIALMSLFPNWIVATVGMLGAQGAYAVMGASRNLFSQEIVAPRWRTTTSALATIGLALGWATMAAFGGYAITFLGYRAFFLAAALLTLASAILLLVYLRRPNVAVTPAVAAVD